MAGEELRVVSYYRMPLRILFVLISHLQSPPKKFSATHNDEVAGLVLVTEQNVFPEVIFARILVLSTFPKVSI
jgi:hypothetical protein